MSVWKHRSAALFERYCMFFLQKFLASREFCSTSHMVPHEICVVPFGYWKIASDWNGI